MFPTITGDRKVVILDGGLGTTLEQTFGLDISHTPLWSAKAAVEHPTVIVDAHLAFLRAGAQIILTSTYQCSPSTFAGAGYGDEEGEKLMCKCVLLAEDARVRFLSETHQNGGDAEPGPKIALSLGPFGAGLSPAQEFDAFYPPPYGPRAYTTAGPNVNAFSPEEGELEAAATEALAQYHLERLSIVAADPRAWAAVDLIAFETVPLLREIRAIRIAVGRLAARGLHKPWWISFVFPGGRFPETGGVTVRSVMDAAFGSGAGDGNLGHPSALGVNCTDAGELPRILQEMQAALGEMGRGERDEKPWLVVYPNGGDIYDPVTQSWIVKSVTSGPSWAQRVGAMIKGIDLGDTLNGIVVGGCCRTGPADIRELGDVLKRDS
ncbi:unnamed protein product [Mycena citricolor]|uniref:Hcy-binding domain-containing protein n=1 Tax=Mycena citricolor TaxID=2018698 RepID=A0AAD2K612_9AGAR|nr:unnamed protein product [Mycena citricolor]